MMPSRVLKSIHDLQQAASAIDAFGFPCTLNWVKGAKRTNPQNRIIHAWYGEAASQLGDVTFEEVRAACKLMFGVPILRRDDVVFKSQYDETFRALPYETKVTLFQALDPAITSKMSVGQLTEYMTEMRKHYAEGGVLLRETGVDEC